MKFGVTDMEDFTWKTILDGYTCTHCGRCTSVCRRIGSRQSIRPAREIMSGVPHHRTMDKGPL